MDRKEIAQRYKRRKRGEDVPKIKPGVKRGYKQSKEHIAKRIKSGEEHPNWVGDLITQKSARSRAIRWFKEIGPCVKCGSEKAERHHIDGNTANNEPENILALCRRCHMLTDGRLEKLSKLAIENNKKRSRKKQL